MSEWQYFELSQLADIRVSNVDKKSKPGQEAVTLCNYMDVYANDYIRRDLPFMESTASFDERTKFAVDYGDVIITKDSETPYDIGIPSVVIDEIPNLVCGYHLALLKPKKYLVDSIFLCKQIASTQLASYFSRVAAGSTRYGLSNGAIAKALIPAPSKVEQQQIAKILQTIDQSIESTQALIEKYQLIKAGLMHDLFTRGIGADGKLRPPREAAPELYQETAIGWIPKDWTINRINDLAAPYKGSTTIGPFGSDLVMSDYRNEGCPIIFVRDVKESGFNWVSNVFVSDKKAQRLFAHRVNRGDILATKMGLPPCIACVYPDDMPMGVITADLIRMTVDEKKVIPSWLSSAINHDRIVRQVAAITAGVTRPKVTLEDFRKLKVAFPEMGEQIAINAMLENQHNLLVSEEKKLEKLRKQKAGLMQDLLTGKVQVKVDDDESDN